MIDIIVGCEFSQTVTAALRARGYNAFSCDLLPTEGNPDWHIQGDILEVANSKRWDGGIFHPPCTYICSSGLHWNARTPGREQKTIEAIQFVEKLWNLPIDMIAIENPIGCLPTRSKLGKATQIIQPWQFGHDASKATCLWLKNLPPLYPTEIIPPRAVGGKERWGNQTDSGQNRLPPSKDRWALRSVTYGGVAEAMATQWFN